MSTPTHIMGSNNIIAKVTRSGELIVAPLSYSESEFRQLDATGIAFNFFGPKPKKQFIITGYSLKADRQVSNTVDARVVVYEASSLDSTTEDKILIEDAMIRGERVALTNTNLKVNGGKWINATTTDASIFISIYGYYIDEL